jgi:hypothetical protein
MPFVFDGACDITKGAAAGDITGSIGFQHRPMVD